MGKPAARLTDTTSHGGTVVGPGVPNVLIGGLPAVGLGDQHVCPMATPGTPPIPHVGGPILLGSTGVLIGKKPAARMGDMAFCVGPPSQIILGCTTVLIGEAGSGSKAGEAGKAIAAKRAKVLGPKKLKPMPVRTHEASPTENHAIHCRIKDKAGRPLAGLRYELTDHEGQTLRGSASSEGVIFHPGYPQKGRFKGKIATIGNVKWGKPNLRPGEEATLSAQVDGKDGETVFGFLNAVLSDNARVFQGESELKIKGKAIRFQWQAHPENWEGIAEASNSDFVGLELILLYRGALAVSSLLPLRSELEFQVKKGNKPLQDWKVPLRFPEETSQEVVSDSEGQARLKRNSIGFYALEIMPSDEAEKKEGGQPKTLQAPQLSLQDKIRIVRFTAQFESGARGYWAINRDDEFNGRLDRPRNWYRDTPERKKTARPDGPGPDVQYSKYTEHPRRVGISFGLIQFTQESSLGILVANMRKKNPDRFQSIFGEHCEDLVKVLNESGAPYTRDEELFDNFGKSMGIKKVRLNKRIQPVGGHELWEDYWVERFIESGKTKDFQDVQIEAAVRQYFDSFLDQKYRGRVISEKSLSLLYDRSVQRGPSRARKLLPEVLKSEDERAFWTGYSKAASGASKRRMETLMEEDELKWENRFSIG